MCLLKQVAVLLVLCIHVSSSEASFLRDQIESTNVNILQQYLIKSVEINENPVDHSILLVAGGSQAQRSLAIPLMKTFPYYVGTNETNFVDSGQFGRYSVIVYFLDSLSEEYVQGVMKSLINFRRARIYLVFNEAATYHDIDFVLRVAFDMLLERVVFTHQDEWSVKFYSYEQITNDTMVTKRIGEWTPEQEYLKRNIIEKDLGIGTSSLHIGTVKNMPWIGLGKAANGELAFRSGSEGLLMSEIAKYVNVTLKVQVFDRTHVNESSEKEAIVSRCAAGKLDMGVGHIRTIEHFISQVDVSTPTGRECLIWCVPRINEWSQYILFAEFSWFTWLLIGLTFLFSCAIENFIRNASYLNGGNAEKSRFSVILDTIAITLGYPIVYRSISRGGKFLLLAYLCYSLIITTAYKTSLSSMMTVHTGQPLFTSTEDLIRGNITIGGRKSALLILKDQAEDSELTRELIKRFVVYRNVTKALRQISEQKNLALLITRTTLAYNLNLLAKAREPVFFDILDDCVLTYNTVLVARKGTRVMPKVNRVIQHLTESGILQYWRSFNSGSTQFIKDMTKRLGAINFMEEGRILTRAKFFQLFYIYFALQGFCILVFLGELLVHKIQSKKRIARLELLKRSIKFKSAPTPPDLN